MPDTNQAPTSDDLRTFKAKVQSGGAWTPALQAELYGLVKPTALAVQQRVIAAPNLSRCMDNIVIMGPKGWSRSISELPPGTSPKVTAGYSLYVDGGLRMEVYGTGDTMAAAMMAACAEVWAWLLDHQ